MTSKQPADPREDRRQALARMPKFRLIRMLQPYVITAHPLSTWTKDEIVASLLDREFPPPAASPAAPDHLPAWLDPAGALVELGAVLSPALSRPGPLVITARDCVLCGPDQDCRCAEVEFGSDEYFARINRLHGRGPVAGQ